VPIGDLWISVLALEHDLTLNTRYTLFRRFPQLLQSEF
jgi:predicted nucleic acid-binding protein